MDHRTDGMVNFSTQKQRFWWQKEKMAGDKIVKTKVSNG